MNLEAKQAIKDEVEKSKARKKEQHKKWSEQVSREHDTNTAVPQSNSKSTSAKKKKNKDLLTVKQTNPTPS